MIDKRKKQPKVTSMNFTGPSMRPILKHGDLLQIIPYHGQKISRGDVIAFLPPEGEQRIVHRVISIGSEGIRTRGDYCTHIDPWILYTHHVIGRIIYAIRGKKQHRIYGGFWGCLSAMAVRAFHLTDRIISFLFRPIYYWMARRGSIRRWTEGLFQTRVLSFKRPDGKELQLLMGKRIVGKWLPGNDGWHIRRPFRLFVNEASLPENPSKSSK